MRPTRILPILASGVLIAILGCGADVDKIKKANDAKVAVAAKTAPKHDNWWCEEHGVPEHLCSLCSESMAKKCKADGDWCKEHDRADSQCFKCDPAKYAKFEAMYEAKYGKKPARPPEEEFKK
jgi:hypothetical protein